MPDPESDNKAEQTLRLFVAIELPDDVRGALSGTIDELRRAGISDDVVRWVRPEGVHLTLKFLGGTPAEHLSKIGDALGAATQNVSRFDVQTGGVGSFHGGRKAHFVHEHQRARYARNISVIWVGLRGDIEALQHLANKVDEHLSALGIPRERHAFQPHLTLGRIRDQADGRSREEVARIVHPARGVGRNAPQPPVATFGVDRVSLMRSTLGRGGAVYDALATFPLE